MRNPSQDMYKKFCIPHLFVSREAPNLQMGANPIPYYTQDALGINPNNVKTVRLDMYIIT